MVLDGTNGRKAVVVRKGDGFVVARLAAVARCLPPRRATDVDVTVADDAIQSNEPSDQRYCLPQGR